MGGSWFLEIIAFVCEMENVLQPLVALNDNVVVWSSAGLLTLIIFLVDQFADTDLDNPHTPAVGVFSCWIYSRFSTKIDYNICNIIVLKY